MGFPLLDIVGIAGKLLDKILPDKEANAAAKAKLLELQLNGELEAMRAETDLAKGQMEVNKTEALNANLFVSGWRPFIGWCCGAIFIANFFVIPVLAWASPIWNIPPPPRLEVGEVMTVLGGMLGLGSLRTVEKVQAMK